MAAGLYNARRRAARSLAVPAGLASLALAGLAGTSGQQAAATTAAAGAGTDLGHPSTAWARLADRVPTPVLHWRTCRKIAQCATAELPLDYHQPHGQRIKVALLRIRATDRRHRLGSLFVNPGGPGQPARVFAESASRAWREHFDIVGVDPRGTGRSTPIRCFATKAEQVRTETPLLAVPFPGPPAQQRSWIRAARALGRACSTTGQPIASAMSTTDDALDMDVLRRAVGDRKLTYFGQSYGSYLGLVYANMFPHRVRAIAIDGIVDPRAAAGTPATAHVPVYVRIDAPAASYRALRKLLALCQQTGKPSCSFASADTQARYARLARRLRNNPLHLAAPGIKATTFTYPDLVRDSESWMHIAPGYKGLFPELTDLARLTAPGGGGVSHAALVRALLRLHSLVRAPRSFRFLEASSGVTCADSLSAASAASWPAAAAAADRQVPYFGALYAWLTVPCARRTWTAHDQDVYRGPFDRRTDAPVLVVGAWWDPATSFFSAKKVARMLPNSRLVSSDNWGHESLGTSVCVDNTITGYLIRPQAPAPKVTHCRSKIQPFGARRQVGAEDGTR